MTTKCQRNYRKSKTNTKRDGDGRWKLKLYQELRKEHKEVCSFKCVYIYNLRWMCVGRRDALRFRCVRTEGRLSYVSCIGGCTRSVSFGHYTFTTTIHKIAPCVESLWNDTSSPSSSRLEGLHEYHLIKKSHASKSLTPP